MTARRRLLALMLPLCGAGTCVDPTNLPEMDFGVAEADVWKDGAARVAAATPGEVRLLITNNLDDTVSVVSWNKLLAGGRDAELARFPVGLVPLEREGPHHVTADTSGRFGYVGISNFVPGGGSGPHGIHGSGTVDGRALKIDLDTRRTIAAVRVDKNPGDIRLAPDGSLLVMSHFDLVKVTQAAANNVFVGDELDARIAMLDPETMERLQMVTVCPAPHGMAFTSDGATIVSSCLSDEAAIVDVARALAGRDDAVTRVALLDVPGTAASPLCSPYAVTMSADDSTAWISCYSSGELVAVDVAGRQRGATLTLPGLAVFGDVSDAGDTFAIATQDTDGVVLFATDAPGQAELLRFIPLSPDVCTLPHTVHFFDADTRLAVVCEGNKRSPGSVVALDLADDALLGVTTLGLFPDDIAVAVKP